VISPVVHKGTSKSSYFKDVLGLHSHAHATYSSLLPIELAGKQYVVDYWTGWTHLVNKLQLSSCCCCCCCCCHDNDDARYTSETDISPAAWWHCHPFHRLRMPLLSVIWKEGSTAWNIEWDRVVNVLFRSAYDGSDMTFCIKLVLELPMTYCTGTHLLWAGAWLMWNTDCPAK